MLRKKVDQESTKLRDKVLAVVNDSPVKLTGIEIAKRAGLDYKQTIDALDALNNYGRILRIGKKFNTRWMRIENRKPVDVYRWLNVAFWIMRRRRLRKDQIELPPGK
ncbi:MAG: hypothetical protein HRU77_01585 [Gammaproteobacteria bacterium]|nr:MAG: hypothetical protein HRU77_01585 [Gammaproteobacteria bacterium]